VVKPPCPWLGNKAQLLPYIQQLLPPKKEQFLDAFGGGGSVILNQPPKRGRLDIYNDLDDNLFNLMLCIREKLLALCNALKFLPVQGRTAFKFYQNFDKHEAEFYKNIEQEMELLHDRTLVSEEQAAKFLSLLLERKGLFDVYRAAAFLMVRYGSFSGTGSSFGVKTIDVEAITKRMPAISKRLQSIQYIPKTIEDNGKTLTLQDISWQTDNTANVDGYAMGDRFTAVATYTGTSTSSYVKGYTVTADYTGTVSKIALNRVRYVAIFEGTELTPTISLDEAAASAVKFNWAYVLVPLGVVAVAGAGVGTALFIKRRNENGEVEAE
jgi:hypothetical protein